MQNFMLFLKHKIMLIIINDNCFPTSKEFANNLKQMQSF